MTCPPYTAGEQDDPLPPPSRLPLPPPSRLRPPLPPPHVASKKQLSQGEDMTKCSKTEVGSEIVRKLQDCLRQRQELIQKMNKPSSDKL
jgi:hypothetical protein